MGTVASSIRLQDNMTPVISSMLKSMNTMISTFENIEKASGQAIDTKSLAAARTQLQSAGAAFQQVQKSIENSTKQQNDFNKSIGNGTSSANGLWTAVKGIAVTVATYAGVNKLLDMSDTYSQNLSRLSLMNDGLQTTDQLQNMIVGSAIDARSEYQSMADMVAKLGLMSADAFSSSADVVRFSELMSKQFKIGGASAGEAASATQQLSQAMASGVLRGDEFNSIMENAPMYAKSLSAYLGVSTGQLRKMAENGELTSNILVDAMFATADQTEAAFNAIKPTFRDVWTVFKTNAGEAWENVNRGLTDLANSPGLQTFFNNVVNGIANLTPSITNAVNGFITFANNPDVQNMFSGLIQGVSSLIGFMVDATVGAATFIGCFAGVDGIATAVGLIAGGFIAVKAAMAGMGAINGIMGAIGSLGTGTAAGGMSAAFTALAGPVGIAIVAIAALTAVIAGAWQQSESFRNSVATAFESIGQTAQTAFQSVSTAFAPVITSFQGFGTTAMPLLKQVGDFLGGYVVPAIQWMVETFIAGFARVLTMFAPFFSALGNLLSFIGNFVGMVVSLLNGDWSGAWMFAQNMAKNACDFVVNILSGFWGLLTGIIAGIAQSVFDGFMNAWNFVVSVGQMIVDAASNAYWGMINAIANALLSLFPTITTGFQGAIDFISGLPAKFLQWGVDMIQNLIDGVKNMAGGAVEAVGNIVNDIITRFKQGFGIASPSKVLYEIGSYLMQGLVNSVLDSNIMTFFNGIIEDIKAAFAGGNFGIKTFIDFVGGGAAEFLKSIGIGGATLGNLVTPVAGAVTSGFGSRDAFMTDSGQMSSSYHEGIDIGAAYGDAVGAAGAGTVTFAGDAGGYGNMVRIDHGGGLTSMYAHLSSILVSVGDIVSKLQTIGLVGSTGNSTGAHLHFGLYQDGAAIDPSALFSGYARGTNFATPGLHLVGENGPEILSFAGGEKVLDANKSKAILNSTGSQKTGSNKTFAPIIKVSMGDTVVNSELDIEFVAKKLGKKIVEEMTVSAKGLYEAV